MVEIGIEMMIKEWQNVRGFLTEEHVNLLGLFCMDPYQRSYIPLV